MSDDIQKINAISGGQNAQNVNGNQIYIKNQTNNFQNSEFKNSTALDNNNNNNNNNNEHVNKQTNNFQNNFFFIFNFVIFNLDWIFKSFNNKDLSSKQFLFLLLSNSILFFLLIGLFLLPLFSINKHNISFFEFTGMIGIFIFLCSWYWSKIKKEKNYE